MKRGSYLLHAALVLSLLCTPAGASREALNIRSVGAEPPRRAPKIAASAVIEELEKRKKERPGVSPRELAAYGNALIREKGFDYLFDACDILKANGRTGEGTLTPTTEKLETFGYRIARVGGREMAFDILSRDNEGSGGMCGECFFEIPVFRVTRDEMDVRAGGARYRLRRPKAFTLDEAALVDGSMRRVIRTWQMPFEAAPAGVSADGTKLYVEFYEGQGPQELLIELSADGTLKLRPRGDVRLQGRGERIDEHPTDPKNSYLSFMRFKSGRRSYVVKFTAPCT